MTAFDHEKLDVYQVALEFVAMAGEIVGEFPSGRHSLADQLDRATSVVLNIAEGAGEFSRAEKARFYRMAKRSATERAAALDVCRVRRFAEPKKLEAGREMLVRVVSMLIRMIHGLESGLGRDRRTEESGTGRGTHAGTESQPSPPPQPR